ncbi:MAG: cytidine deaminase [Alphaproteobacteria bacterium]
MRPNDILEPLVAAALKAQRSAYAPYSRHPVGAALMTGDGRVFAGCNVENAAFPSGLCAEASAIAAMVAGGGRRIAHLVVAGPADVPCTPCGQCRQRIHEFADPEETHITVVNRTGEVLLETTIAELLPHAFGPENLPGGGKT